MYLKAVVSTLAAWFVGLLLDVNLPGDWQILCLRGLWDWLRMRIFTLAIPKASRACGCFSRCWPWGFASSAS